MDAQKTVSGFRVSKTFLGKFEKNFNAFEAALVAGNYVRADDRFCAIESEFNFSKRNFAALHRLNAPMWNHEYEAVRSIARAESIPETIVRFVIIDTEIFSINERSAAKLEKDRKEFGLTDSEVKFIGAITLKLNLTDGIFRPFSAIARMCNLGETEISYATNIAIAELTNTEDWKFIKKIIDRHDKDPFIVNKALAKHFEEAVDDGTFLGEIDWSRELGFSKARRDAIREEALWNLGLNPSIIDAYRD